MANLRVIAAQRVRARATLREWSARPLALRRRVYFVPGFTDEDGRSCWGAPGDRRLCLAARLPAVCADPGLATFVDFRSRGAPPRYEDFVRFGARLARLVERDRAGAGEAAEVDLVCHSMGGLDALAAVALLEDHPELDVAPLRGVRNVVAFDTPFLGFAAAANPLLRRLKRGQRPDEPWLASQLLAMETGSPRMAEVARARDRFLSRVGALWPRGADNAAGLIEVPHESASFGDAEDFDEALRGRHRGYRAWEDTSHSGAKGLTRDPRAIVELLRILTGEASGGGASGG